MHDLEVDLDELDDAGPGGPDAPPASGRRLRTAVALTVAGGLAAGLVAVGAVVVPRLVPAPAPPSVTVDDVTDLVLPERPLIDLHEDADGRPVGPATVTLQVVLRVTGVPEGLHGSVAVLAPTGPGIGPGEKPGPAVAAVVGTHVLGALTFTVSCTAPGGAGRGRYAVPVAFGHDGARALATGSLRDGLGGLVDRVCAARTQREDLRVTAVAPVRGRPALALTVGNRGMRPATLDWVLADPPSVEQAPPGTSTFVVPVTRATCVAAAVVGTGPDDAAAAGSTASTDIGLGLLGGVPPDDGSGFRLAPVAFTAAAKDSLLRGIQAVCGNPD